MRCTPLGTAFLSASLFQGCGMGSVEHLPRGDTLDIHGHRPSDRQIFKATYRTICPAVSTGDITASAEYIQVPQLNAILFTQQKSAKEFIFSLVPALLCTIAPSVLNSGTWSTFADHPAEDLAGAVKPVIPIGLGKVLKAQKWQEMAKVVSDYQLNQAGHKGGGKNDSF